MHCGADPRGKIRKRDHKIDTMPSARHSAESRCYSSKMDKELEQRFVERWPHWFNTEGCVCSPPCLWASGLPTDGSTYCHVCTKPWNHWLRNASGQSTASLKSCK